MNRFLLLLAICLFLIANLTATKYAGEIFRMGAGVRNFALGRTGLTDADSPALAYWNASLLLNQTDNVVEVMHAEEFKGLLKYDTFSGYYGQYNMGVTLSRIGINNVAMTALPNPDEPPSEDNKPYKYKSVNNSDYILYVGFARAIGGIPVGITPKIAYRTLAEETAFGFGMDIAAHYVVSDGVIVALRVRDLIPTQIYWENGTKDAVHIGFDIETQIKSMLPVIEKPIIFFTNVEINTERMSESATANLGDVSFDPHIGVEFILHPMISLLAGYDIEYFTAGIGLNYKQFRLNYAFEQNSELDNSHRVSVGYRF